MTNDIQEENHILQPIFHTIWKAFQDREKLKVVLGTFTSEDPTRENESLLDLVNEIFTLERDLLANLIDLKGKVELALRDCGKGFGQLNLICHFRPFKIAQSIRNNADTIEANYYAYVCKQSSDVSNGQIEEVLHMIKENGRIWFQIDIAFDLLQYWEIYLTYQTTLECKEFCEGCRRYLLTRVSGTLFREGVANGLPEVVNCKLTQDRSMILLRENAERRLEKIARRLNEEEAKRVAFSFFKSTDGVLGSEQFSKLKSARDNYCDEVSLIISELVNLRDNIIKYLKSPTNSKQELDVVEKMLPFRIASCFVNIDKHGIRGTTKTAVFEAFVHFHNDDELLGIEPLINYDGTPWQATKLIDSLLQLWELFVRNHTDINTQSFRKTLARRLSIKQGVVTYSLILPDEMETYFVKQSLERRNIP